MSGGDYDSILKLLEKLKASEIQLDEDELISVLTNIQERCQVPPLQNSNVPYSASDFEGVARDAEMYLSVILKLLDTLYFSKKERGQQFTFLFLRYNVVTCLLTACQYCDESWEWSSQAAAGVSKKIMDKLCELYCCDTVQELLMKSSLNTLDEKGSHENENPPFKGQRPDYLKHVLQRLSEVLNKDNWKIYPSLKMSYWWILRNVKKNYIGDHLVYLLPPALFIVDDWESKNKLLGVQCLNHIVEKTVGSELRWYGRAAVIYDALKPLLYTREPDVLQSLYPTIIEVAKVLEADPAKAGKLQKESTLDFIMQRLIQEMAFEQNLSMRSVYAAALPLVIPAMNLYAVRWSKELMDVCSDYLATFEGPAAQDRIHILKALQGYVKACWPQVHVHACAILKMTVHLLYDVTEEGSGVELQSVQFITHEAESLIHLLHEAAPNTVQELCQGLQDVCVHPQCQLLLHNIQTTIVSR